MKRMSMRQRGDGVGFDSAQKGEFDLKNDF